MSCENSSHSLQKKKYPQESWINLSELQLNGNVSLLTHKRSFDAAQKKNLRKSQKSQPNHQRIFKHRRRIFQELLTPPDNFRERSSSEFKLKNSTNKGGHKIEKVVDAIDETRSRWGEQCNGQWEECNSSCK